jgi:hypothetical protein
MRSGVPGAGGRCLIVPLLLSVVQAASTDSDTWQANMSRNEPIFFRYIVDFLPPLNPAATPRLVSAHAAESERSMAWRSSH